MTKGAGFIIGLCFGAAIVCINIALSDYRQSPEDIAEYLYCGEDGECFYSYDDLQRWIQYGIK